MKEIQSCLEKRDHKLLREINGKQSQLLSKLLECVGPAEECLNTLSSIDLSEEAARDVKDLMSVYQDLKEALEVYGLGSVNITIDPLEQKGFEYQSGVSFTFFSKNARGELGRGGQYVVEFGKESQEKAIGFTLYMDSIRRILKTPEAEKRISVVKDESWSVIQGLQSDGWSVIRGTEIFCSHKFENGKIVEITNTDTNVRRKVG